MQARDSEGHEVTWSCDSQECMLAPGNTRVWSRETGQAPHPSLQGSSSAPEPRGPQRVRLYYVSLSNLGEPSLLTEARRLMNWIVGIQS